MKANKKFAELKDDKRGYAQMIGGIIGLLVVIIVGILVYWQIAGSITLTSDTANTSRDNVNSTATTVFQLLPIIAIITVGAVMIGIIMKFGSNR